MAGPFFARGEIVVKCLDRIHTGVLYFAVIEFAHSAFRHVRPIRYRTKFAVLMRTKSA